MNRQPSTPPPLGQGEEINPFQTPSVKKDSTHTHVMKSKKDHKLLFTPQTPCLPNKNSEYQLPMSPQTSKKIDNYIDVLNKSKTANALRTPEMTPRNQCRKIDLLEGSSKTNAPLFPSSRATEQIRRGNLDFSKSYKIDETEELLSTSSSEETDEESKSRINDLSNQISKSIPTIDLPWTPPNQIMDDDYLQQKFGIEKCAFVELENMKETFDDLNRTKKVIHNPFVSGYRIDKNKKKPDYARLENEIELVYHVTGQKFHVPMPKDSQLIKPKRLNFDNLDIDMYSEENTKTPEPSPTRKNIMSIKGLLNEDKGARKLAEHSKDDRNDIKYGVRHEKIRNPFVTGNAPGSDHRNGLGDTVRSRKSRFSTRSGDNEEIKGVRFKGLEKDDKDSIKGVNSSILNSIDYINMSTGDRVTENMDEEQQAIKPKRLNFD